MKQILFPTDFSEAANVAFVYALNFADAIGAEVTILHVYDLPIVETPPLPESTKEIFNVLEANKAESFKEELLRLQQLAEEKDSGNIKLNSELLYGDLVYNINKLTKEQNVVLVVMGTTGATGTKEIFLGSNAASVIGSVDNIPVLAVPINANFSEKVNSIVFTTQYQEKDTDAFNKTLNIARSLKAKVYCLYIKTPDDPTNIEERINEWKILYKDNDVSFFNIDGDHIEQTIIDFVENQKVDMLVMLKHKRGFFESLFHRSLTKKMAYHTSVPLMVYHEK